MKIKDEEMILYSLFSSKILITEDKKMKKINFSQCLHHINKKKNK